MKKNKIVNNFKQNKKVPNYKNNKKVPINTDIDISEYKNYSIKCKLGRYNTSNFNGNINFTNFLKSVSEGDMLTKKEEEIYKFFLENNTLPKFHVISELNRKKLLKILCKYDITCVDKEFYYAGINQGVRFIFSDENIDGNNVWKLIFVDFHHLLYPYQKHNMLDTDSYKYCVRKRNETGFPVM